MTTNHFVVGLVAIIVVLIFIYLLIHPTAQDIVYRLPAPPLRIASWLFGHELLIFSHDASQMYSIWANQLGSMFRIRSALFLSDILVTVDHHAVQHILAHSRLYVKPPEYRNLISHLLGKGIVWAEGDEHIKQRRMLTPAFSLEAVKGMMPDIIYCAEQLENALIHYLKLKEVGGTAEVNIVEVLSACALDIIGRAAFGHDFKATSDIIISAKVPVCQVDSDATRIRKAWAKLVRDSLTFTSFCFRRLLRAAPVLARIPLPGLGAEGTTTKTIKRLASQLLKQDVGCQSSEKSISSILNKTQETNNDGDSLTDDQILNNLSTLIMAGHETSASSMVFILAELAKYPELQFQLREEVRNSRRDLSYDSIQQLEFLDAVVKEGLRLHPVSPVTERVALQTDILPLARPIKDANGELMTSVQLKKGQTIHIPFKVINTQQSIWGPDAACFRPERWLITGGIPPPSQLPHGWSGITSFSDGPRMCIGWRLAVLEIKVVLACLIHTFEFQTTEVVTRMVIAPSLQAITEGQPGVLPLNVRLAP